MGQNGHEMPSSMVRFVTMRGPVNHKLALANGIWVLPSGSVVNNPPAGQEMWVQSLDQDDPPEEGLATHASILAWRIPWTEELGGLRSMGSQRDTTTVTECADMQACSL